MNRIVMFAAVLALAPCAAFVPAAHAASTAKPLVAQTLDSFKQDAARIRTDMQPGGKYGYISAADRSRVEADLTDMQNLLTAHANASDMPQTDKVALLNAQEQINGILNHNDNDRLVCEHVAPIGSHIPVTTCHTYGELMAQQRRAQKFLEDRGEVSQTKRGN